MGRKRPMSLFLGKMYGVAREQDLTAVNGDEMIFLKPFEEKSDFQVLIMELVDRSGRSVRIIWIFSKRLPHTFPMGDGAAEVETTIIMV